MSSAPYGVRLLVGAAATAVEETLRLPQTILTYPMTVASQVAQLFMKVQQDMAELVNKGDETLESLFPPKDEQPEWATFDEDLADNDHEVDGHEVHIPVANDGARLTEGRFALFSDGPADPQPQTKTEPSGPVEVPQIATTLDYASLTLAQLRARVASLKLGDLQDLLTYENLTKARAPFQTLLSNRITRVTAK